MGGTELPTSHRSLADLYGTDRIAALQELSRYVCQLDSEEIWRLVTIVQGMLGVPR